MSVTTEAGATTNREIETLRKALANASAELDIARNRQLYPAYAFDGPNVVQIDVASEDIAVASARLFGPSNGLPQVILFVVGEWTSGVNAAGGNGIVKVRLYRDGQLIEDERLRAFAYGTASNNVLNMTQMFIDPNPIRGRKHEYAIKVNTPTLPDTQTGVMKDATMHAQEV